MTSQVKNLTGAGSIYLTRRQLLVVLSITAFYWAGQLLTGTDEVAASLFAAAIFFGILAVWAGGGLRSAFGCLNALLIGKFLLFGLAVKIMLLEPADSTLLAPRFTASVMALGFFGLFLGTTLQSLFPCPQSWSMNRPLSDRMFLSFAVVLLVASYAGYFAGMTANMGDAGVQTGGYLGVARALGSLTSLSIVPPMLYLWRIRTPRWMTHPVIVSVLIWATMVGIFSTGKQQAIEPLVFYVFVGFLRYGGWDWRLWALVSVGTTFYALLVFPYSQYVRDAGGREGTFEDRIETTRMVFWKISTDQDFRSAIRDRVSHRSFFERAALSPFNRLAMVGEADRLISATNRLGSFTGWTTITWGFELLTPSFLYPDKPTLQANNYLAHIVGDAGPSDHTTQVSYGVMANLYNALSFPGVLIGTALLFGGLYYWIRIFLGQPRWEAAPTASTLWFIWLIASYHHSLAESSLSGVIASLAFPFVIGLLSVLAICLCLLLPRGPVKI
jgi:hypothetical protein